MAEDFLEFEVRPTLSNTAQREVDKSIKGIGKSFNKVSENIDKNLKGAFEGAKKGFGGISTAISSISPAITGLIAGVSSIVGAVKGIKIAAAFEQEQEKLKFAMGDMSKDIQNFIKDMNKATGVGEVALTKTVGKIGLKAKGLGFTGEILAKNTKNMTKLAYDMAGAMNMTSEEGTQVLSSTLSGEMGALKEKTGVTINNEEIEAYAKSLGIAKEQLSETQKAQIRLNILQDKMKDIEVKGGLEGAIGTFDWIFGNLSNQIEDLTIKVFTPLKNKIAEIFKVLPTFIANNSDKFEKFGEVIGEAFGNIWDIIVKITNKITPLIEKFIQWGETSGYFEYMSARIKAVWEIAKALGEAVWEIFEAITDVINEAFGESDTSIFDTMLEVVNTLLPILLEIIKVLTDIVVTIIKVVGPIIIKVFKEVYSFIESVIKVAIDGINKVLSWINKLTGKSFKIEAPEMKLPEGVEENVGSSFKGLDVGGYTPVKLDVASPYANNSYSPTIQVTNNGNNEKDYTKKLSENIEKFHSDLGYDTRLKLVYGKG